MELKGDRDELISLRRAAGPLLDWYRSRARDLPWRRSRDPYRILVSEVMLQQTQVEVVRPRFDEFLSRFPTVEALAAASVEDVLASWSGLGYYRRARSLHQAARQVVDQHAGRFPREVEVLRTLSGVGAYTAAAVSSIAFGRKVAVLDGNVERVLARVLRLEADPKKAAARRTLQTTATQLLVDTAPGDSNQALMELGATVCRPRRWDCPACPLESVCRGARVGDVERYPFRRPKRPIEEWEWEILRIRDPLGRWLLQQRAKDAPFLPGVWLPPGRLRVRQPELDQQGGTATGPEGAAAERLDEPTAERILASVATEFGCKSWVLGREAVVRHSVTFRRFRVPIREVLIEEPELRNEGEILRWVAEEQFAELATSSLLAKIQSATRSWSRSVP